MTYCFPPQPAIGAVRLGGIAKYLPEFGWEPTFLTPCLPGVPNAEYDVVQTAYRGRVARIEDTIYSDRHLGKRWFEVAFNDSEGRRREYVGKLVNLIGEVASFPDGHKGWMTTALPEADRLLQRRSYDAILSCSLPNTAHLIARELKRRYHLPWMADFRDPWTLNQYYPYSRLRRFFERRMERTTMSQADALSITSHQWARDMQSLHADIPVFTIFNGYDQDEMYPAPLTRKFTITHTGKLYEGKRDPSILFEAIAQLVGEGRLKAEDIQVRLYGRKQKWLDDKIQFFNLTQIVREEGLISRDEALLRQRESQVLLLLNWDDPRNEGACPAKLFEYFSAGRPVISVGTPSGVVSEILDDTKAGKYPNDLISLKETILDYYAEYRLTGEVIFPGMKQEIEK